MYKYGTKHHSHSSAVHQLPYQFPSVVVLGFIRRNIWASAHFCVKHTLYPMSKVSTLNSEAEAHHSWSSRTGQELAGPHCLQAKQGWALNPSTAENLPVSNTLTGPSPILFQTFKRNDTFSPMKCRKAGTVFSYQQKKRGLSRHLNLIVLPVLWDGVFLGGCSCAA